MNDEIFLDTKEFLQAVKQWHGQNITMQRTHAQQVCLLAGAIAAFLIPVYSATRDTPLQHALVVTSIASFLLCILIGMFHLSAVLIREGRTLSDMRTSIEDKDKDAASRIEAGKTEKPRIARRRDFLDRTTYLLFGAGIVILIAALFVGEYAK